MKGAWRRTASRTSHVPSSSLGSLRYHLLLRESSPADPPCSHLEGADHHQHPSHTPWNVKKGGGKSTTIYRVIHREYGHFDLSKANKRVKRTRPPPWTATTQISWRTVDSRRDRRLMILRPETITTRQHQLDGAISTKMSHDIISPA